MPQWTTAADVTGAWIGDDVPEDTAKIDLWLSKAEREIRRRVPDIEDRLDVEAALLPASTELLDTVRDVAVAMVIRIFQNPRGFRQINTTTGPFSDGGTVGGDNPGTLFLTPDELAKLTGTAESGAFTIDLIPVTSPFSPLYVPPAVIL